MQDGKDGRHGKKLSGPFSADGRFDPDALFRVIAEAENADQATSAIGEFITDGKDDLLKEAIAVYARSARARGETIERVLADLNSLSDRRQERYAHTGELLAPSQLKKLVLTAVFECFGEDDRRVRPR